MVAVDPEKNLGIVGNEGLEPIAKEVKNKLLAVLEALGDVPARSE